MRLGTPFRLPSCGRVPAALGPEGDSVAQGRIHPPPVPMSITGDPGRAGFFPQNRSSDGTFPNGDRVRGRGRARCGCVPARRPVTEEPDYPNDCPECMLGDQQCELHARLDRAAAEQRPDD